MKKDLFKNISASLSACGERIKTALKKPLSRKNADRKRREKSKLSKRQRLVLGLWAAGTALCAAGLAAMLGINAYVKAQTAEYIITAQEAADMQTDCIMVLGCGINDEGEPGYLLTRRLETGLELFQNGAGKKLMMSGDHGRTRYDEVNAMKAWAMERGVSSQDIFMDHAGFSTYESMYRARDVFEVETMIIVSQEYHLYRSVYDARRLGLEVYAVAAQGGTWRSAPREMLARCKDWLWCIFQPEPTFLGDVIPISGSGDMTNDENTLTSSTDIALA